MPNAVTIVIGLAVACVIIIAAYYTYRSMKNTGCAGCDQCPHQKEHK